MYYYIVVVYRGDALCCVQFHYFLLLYQTGGLLNLAVNNDRNLITFLFALLMNYTHEYQYRCVRFVAVNKLVTAAVSVTSIFYMCV